MAAAAWGASERQGRSETRESRGTFRHSQEPCEMHVLIVEDDAFQQRIIAELVEKAATNITEVVIRPKLTVVPSAAGALEACKGRKSSSMGVPAFHLVILDFVLPAGYNGNEVLPGLRASLGKDAAVIMLSALVSELTLRECLSCGADTFRVKPITPATVHDLLLFTYEKQRFLQTHSKRIRSRSSSPLALMRPSGSFLSSSDHLVAKGRRTPLYLTERQGHPIIVKQMKMPVRGLPPPPHPHLNKVLDQLQEGDMCLELRELCDGGELFDILIEEPDGCSPADALKWIVQLVDAVAFCHERGAVHGQLQAENVVVGNGKLQVVGFYCCVPVRSDAADGSGGVDASTRDSEPVRPVELRPFHAIDAPELRGLAEIDPSHLFAADIWALGMLLVLLLTGKHPAVEGGNKGANARPEGETICAISSLVVSAEKKGRGDTSTGCEGLSMSSGSSAASSVRASPASSSGSSFTQAAKPRQLRNSHELVGSALIKLSEVMLNPDPAMRPSAADVLVDLSNIQLCLPATPS